MLAAIQGLELPRQPSVEQHGYMSLQIVNLSEAVRDMLSEITITNFTPADMIDIRNLLQAVIRDLLRIDSKAPLFAQLGADSAVITGLRDTQIEIDVSTSSSLENLSDYKKALNEVKERLGLPTKVLAERMANALYVCDAELSIFSKHSRMLSKQQHESTATIADACLQLKKATSEFDLADSRLLDSTDLPNFQYGEEIVSLLIFIHKIRQTTDSVTRLVERIQIVVNKKNKRRRFWFPSYDWRKAMYRSNPQVRHDRGGMTAGYFFRSKRELELVMGQKPFDPSDLGTTAYMPDTQHSKKIKMKSQRGRLTEGPIRNNSDEPDTLRFKCWKALHELKGYESKFALKVTMTVCLLALPGWLDRSKNWWEEWQSWWVTVTIWLLMQPRVCLFTCTTVLQIL